MGANKSTAKCKADKLIVISTEPECAAEPIQLPMELPTDQSTWTEMEYAIFRKVITKSKVLTDTAYMNAMIKFNKGEGSFFRPVRKDVYRCILCKQPINVINHGRIIAERIDHVNDCVALHQDEYKLHMYYNEELRKSVELGKLKMELPEKYDQTKGSEDPVRRSSGKCIEFPEGSEYGRTDAEMRKREYKNYGKCFSKEQIIISHTAQNKTKDESILKKDWKTRQGDRTEEMKSNEALKAVEKADGRHKVKPSQHRRLCSAQYSRVFAMTLTGIAMATTMILMHFLLKRMIPSKTQPIIPQHE